VTLLHWAVGVGLRGITDQTVERSCGDRSSCELFTNSAGTGHCAGGL